MRQTVTKLQALAERHDFASSQGGALSAQTIAARV